MINNVFKTVQELKGLAVDLVSFIESEQMFQHRHCPDCGWSLIARDKFKKKCRDCINEEGRK